MNTFVNFVAFQNGTGAILSSYLIFVFVLRNLLPLHLVLSKISKNKPDVIKMIQTKTKIDPIVIEKCLDAFIFVVKDMLQRGDSLNLRNFGTFMLKKRSPKWGRNFENNSSVLIPEHFVPFFKPSKHFADKIKKKTSQKILKENR